MAKKNENELAFIEVLKAEPKVKIRIPQKDEKDTDDVPVSINGHIYQIKKGEFVEVPESVAQILINAHYI